MRRGREVVLISLLVLAAGAWPAIGYGQVKEARTWIEGMT